MRMYTRTGIIVAALLLSAGFLIYLAYGAFDPRDSAAGVAPTATVESDAGEDDAPTVSEPVAQALAEINAIVQDYAVDGAAETVKRAPNDEAAPQASYIGQLEATNPAFISEALSADKFHAERVVALIEATPNLADRHKIDLKVAVQAVVEYPEAREQVLARLETILLAQS